MQNLIKINSLLGELTDVGRKVSVRSMVSILERRSIFISNSLHIIMDKHCGEYISRSEFRPCVPYDTDCLSVKAQLPPGHYSERQ